MNTQPTAQTPKLPADFFYGYDYETLKAAFDQVCDPTDWKNPIALCVSGEFVNVVVAAIKFFTATVPEVALNVNTMRYAIYSVGYRNGPAGDH